MFPIQTNIPNRFFPIVTWTLIGVNVFVFMIEISLPKEVLEGMFYLFGLVPARYSHPDWAYWAGLHADNYWPFFTNMFLHGGWLHLIGNMWTLYIFGGNVENRMGRWNFLWFYLLCGIAASITHYYININSTVPSLGASGAISGVMAAFALLYPRGKIVFFIPLLFIPFFFELSAFFYIFVWFFGQIFNGTFSLMLSQNTAGIAFWAHVGGFIAGLALLPVFARKKYKPAEDMADHYYRNYYNYY